MPYTIAKLVCAVNWTSLFKRCRNCGAPIPAGTICINCGTSN